MTEQAKKPIIDRIWLLPLFGNSEKFATVDEAIDYIKDDKNFKYANRERPFIRLEVQIRYTDAVQIDATFPTRERALEYLENRSKEIF